MIKVRLSIVQQEGRHTSAITASQIQYAPLEAKQGCTDLSSARHASLEFWGIEGRGNQRKEGSGDMCSKGDLDEKEGLATKQRGCTLEEERMHRQLAIQQHASKRPAHNHSRRRTTAETAS